MGKPSVALQRAKSGIKKIFFDIMMYMHHGDLMKRTAGVNEDAALAEMLSSCVMMRTRLISRVVTGIYDQELAPCGLNSPQLALLLIIFKMGPASRAEIGRFHRQDRSTLSRNLQIMLSEGWIEEVPEVPEGAGGRAKPVQVTRVGKELLHRAEPAWRAAQAQARQLLGAEGAATVTGIANGILKSEPTA